MRWAWNAVVAALFLLVLMLSVFAVIDNAEPVALRLLEWQTPAISIYWWLVTSLIVGLVLGWLTSLRAKLRLRIQTRQLRREIDRLQHDAAVDTPPRTDRV
jgi:uncharacterized integral membrane protein